MLLLHQAQTVNSEDVLAEYIGIWQLQAAQFFLIFFFCKTSNVLKVWLTNYLWKLYKFSSFPKTETIWKTKLSTYITACLLEPSIPSKTCKLDPRHQGCPALVILRWIRYHNNTLNTRQKPPLKIKVMDKLSMAGTLLDITISNDNRE